ncbi:MAG: hypothetical protein ACP5HK_00065 [Acidilobus sp.]
MITGLTELDEVIADDLIVEFFSVDVGLLEELYSRTIALSSYPEVKVLVVAERGGLDPWLIRAYQRAAGVRGIVLVRRAFKPEDVPPSIDAMGEGDLVVINPYGLRRLYTGIVAAIRGRQGRTFVFSAMDRTREGSVFGLHSAHSVIGVDRTREAIRFRVLKSVTSAELELRYPLAALYMRESRGLEPWTVGLGKALGSMRGHLLSVRPYLRPMAMKPFTSRQSSPPRATSSPALRLRALPNDLKGRSRGRRRGPR